MPSFDIEDSFDGLVVGVDEAGRGPWAGPVVAGAVLIKNKSLCPSILNSLDDSKKLSAKKREFLYEKLHEEEKKGNLLIGVGEVSAGEIDSTNILKATFKAMEMAVSKLNVEISHAIIDGNLVPKVFPCNCSAIIKGDAKSFSISAASIIAKVYRDRLMLKLAEQYPEYGFDKHAGYGTKQHVEALKKYGITPQHRKSYKPIKEYV